MARDAVYPCISDMKNMRAGRFDDHRAQGADVTLVLVVGISAAPGLRMQPRIGRSDHALRRHCYRPGFGRAVIVGEKPLGGRLARDVADLAAADPIGESDRDALQGQKRLVRNHGAVEVLIDLLAPLIAVLPDRYL